MEEAEYEVLLAQPLTMRDYILGRKLFETVQALGLLVFFLPYSTFAYELSGGSLAKALLFPAALLLLQVYASAVLALIDLALIALPQRRGAIRGLALAYLLASILHSAATGGVSPLLTLPSRIAAEPLVYCATISEPVSAVAARLAGSCAVVGAAYALLAKFSNRLHPENVRPLSAIMREQVKRAWSLVKGLYSPSPSLAALKHSLLLSVANLRHALLALSGVGAAAIIGYFVVELLVKRLGISLSGFETSFLAPFVVAEICSVAVASSLVNDLPAIWVYRVYAPSLAPFIRGLLLKYSLYMFEALLALSAFDYMVASQPLNLLYPVSALPVLALSSSLLLLAVSLVASKRRVVKRAPTGLYVLEDLAMLAVFIPVMLAVMFSNAGFKLLASALPGSLIAANAAFSLVVFALLAWALPLPLAAVVQRLDYAS